MLPALPTSFRARLIVLILATAAPVFFLMVYAGLEERSLAAVDVQVNLLRMVRIIVDGHERTIDAAHQFLAGLSRFPEVRERDGKSCAAVFAGLLEKHPQYTSMGAADIEGNVYCSALPTPEPVNVAHRSWFKRAATEGSFAVGDFQISAISGKPGLGFCYPVMDEAGRVRSVVFAILDLGWFNELASRIELPEGAVLTVRDRNGTILVRHPDPEKWVGKSVPDAPLTKEMLARQEYGDGTAELPGVDGVRRYYAFSRLSSRPDSGLFISMGIPRDLALGHAERILRRNLAGLTIVAGLAFLAAWIGGKLFYLHQVRALQDAIGRLSGGDLSARTELAHNHGELSQLAGAFNEMAESVEQLTGRLRQAEAMYRTLVEQVPAVIYAAKPGVSGEIIYISPQIQDILGFTQEEWMAAPGLWAGRLHEEERERVSADMQRRRAGADSEKFSAEYRLLDREGKVVWIHEDVLSVRDGKGEVLLIQGMMRDITARKEGERALRESEAKFRTLIETAPSAIFIHEGKRFTFANPAAEVLTGYTRRELMGMNPFDLAVADSHGLLREIQDAVRADSAIPQRHEIAITSKHGHVRWLDLSVIPIRFEGRIAGLTTAFDITERKRAEEKVRSLSRQNELILQAMGEGIYGLDTNGTITFINPAAALLTGWSVDELIGRRSHPVLHHSWFDGTPYPEELCPVCATLSDGISRHEEDEVFWRKDGTRFPVEYAGTPMRDEGGELVGVVVVFRDISERRRAEEERLRLATAIEQSAESIIITDGAGALQYVNPAFERITGYAREEVIGCHTRILKSGKHDREFYRSIRTAVRRGQVWKGRTINKRKDGSLFEVESTISPVRDSAGSIINYVAVQRDVTHEAELERQLRQAQKMEAIGTLAGGIAHDFNNILSAITGYTELALDGIPEGTTARSDLGQVLKAGERARNLVKQILTFSRQSEQERRPTEIGRIVKEALKLLRASLPSTIEIRQSIAVTPGQDVSLADPTQIHQVLMNLCTNAAHAMRDAGGLLSVRLESIETGVEDGVPELNGRRPNVLPGAYLMLTVSDTGHGIEPALLDRIFDPFFTTKGPGEGTGMGLAVVHGIVKSHGGAISVSSDMEKGTTFGVFLPRVISAERQGEALHARVPLPRGTERILFVDDEEPLVEMGRERLKRLGYSVVTSTSSLHALEMFRADPDAFDLVITDQTMPHLTGVELARAMMTIKPTLPVILCTGYSESITPESAKAAGICEFLMKPIILPEIARTIRDVLDRGEKSASA